MDLILQTLARLNKSGVPYILIGGMAARAHGSSVNTEDVDICILASDEHFRHIVEAFADVHPYYRMQPDKPPLTPDHPWLKGLKNLYLRTDLGQLDVLGDIPEVGDYNAIRDRTVEVDFAGIKCRVLDIPTLIEAKLHEPDDLKIIKQSENFGISSSELKIRVVFKSEEYSRRLSALIRGFIFCTVEIRPHRAGPATS